MELEYEQVVVDVMKAQAILTMIEEMFTDEWQKLGLRGELISAMLCVLGDAIDTTGKDLEALNTARR